MTTLVSRDNVRKFSENEFVFMEGDPGDEMFILRSGTIRIMKREGTRMITLATLGPGSVIGEMSLLDKAPRSATAKTLEKVELIVIGPETLEKTLSKVPGWLNSIIKMMVQRLRTTMTKKYYHDLNNALGSFIFCILNFHDGVYPRSYGNLEGIPVKLIEKEIFSLYGLQGQDVKKLTKFLKHHELVEVIAHPKMGDLIKITDTEPLRLYYYYLIKWFKQKQPKEESLTEEELLTLQLLMDSGIKRGSRRTDDLINLPVRLFEDEIEAKGLSKLTHVQENLETLRKQQYLDVREKVINTRTGNQTQRTIEFSESEMRKIFQYHEFLPKFQKDVIRCLEEGIL